METITDTDWEPKDQDLEFVRNIIALTKDGGIWFFMGGTLAYKLEHSVKTATLHRGDMFDENNLRTTKVFNALGWSMCIPVQKGANQK